MLIGYAENDPEIQARLAAFRQGLEALGWSEGPNILIASQPKSVDTKPGIGIINFNAGGAPIFGS
jgi:hypothetical protein